MCCGKISMMKKEAFKAELEAVMEEAKRLQSKTELGHASFLFFGTEADRLMAKSESGTTSLEEKETIRKQMIALQRRIEHEIATFELNSPEIKVVEDKLSELQSIYDCGLIEE